MFCGADHKAKENDNEDSTCADEPDDEVDRKLLSMPDRNPRASCGQSI